MRAVVGIGAERLEEFDAFGPVLDGADVVIGISAGAAKDLQTGADVGLFFLDDAECVLVECLERIKSAWEEAKPETAHLGHQAAAFFMFYWLAPDLTRIPTLVRELRSADLRAAAADYIESGFAADRGPLLEVPA